jgi:hypothetical protein
MKRTVPKNKLKTGAVLRKILAALVIAVCCSAGGFSLSLHRPKQAPDQANSHIQDDRTVTLRGHIQIYGSEPHTFVGIVTDDGAQYTLTADADVLNELRHNQGKELLLTGTVRSGTSEENPAFRTLKDGEFVLESWKTSPAVQTP